MILSLKYSSFIYGLVQWFIYTCICRNSKTPDTISFLKPSRTCCKLMSIRFPSSSCFYQATYLSLNALMERARYIKSKRFKIVGYDMYRWVKFKYSKTQESSMILMEVYICWKFSDSLNQNTIAFRPVEPDTWPPEFRAGVTQNNGQCCDSSGARCDSNVTLMWHGSGGQIYIASCALNIL